MNKARIEHFKTIKNVENSLDSIKKCLNKGLKYKYTKEHWFNIAQIAISSLVDFKFLDFKKIERLNELTSIEEVKNEINFFLKDKQFGVPKIALFYIENLVQRIEQIQKFFGK